MRYTSPTLIIMHDRTVDLLIRYTSYISQIYACTHYQLKYRKKRKDKKRKTEKQKKKKKKENEINR